jgi:hypothetical protein
MEAKRARHALVQVLCWGVFLSVIGGAIAIGTRPHVGVDGLYAGDETGFWFGVIVFWLGAMLLVVPLVAWGARLGRLAWPDSEDRTVAADVVSAVRA